MSVNELVTPEPFLQLGLGFMASKTLLSAVELGIFTTLASGGRDHTALAAAPTGTTTAVNTPDRACRAHSRSTRRFASPSAVCTRSASSRNRAISERRRVRSWFADRDEVKGTAVVMRSAAEQHE
jgi:hypothetical protein